MELKKVVLNDVHVALGGKMVPFAGFNMPVRYSSDLEEHNQVRNSVGVFDVSHMGEFKLKGPKALDLIQLVTSNDASKLFNGKIQYSTLTNEAGGIVDDLLVYRINEDEYLLVVNASNIDKDWNWISQRNSFGVEMENISDKISLFAVQGPKAMEVLQKLTNEDLSKIEYYSFVTGELAGVSNVIMSATGYTGAGGFEIYVDNDNARKVWDAIFEAGKDVNIKPIGLGARDTLRLEMGYCLYGNDIDDSTSPLEAGLGWITKFTKHFVGDKLIKDQKESGVARKLVGFEMVDRGIPRSHYDLYNQNKVKIGVVTSGTQSPTLGKGIGLGYVKTEYNTPGSEIYVSVREKFLKAMVVRIPFVKS